MACCKKCEAAGAFAILLECVPRQVAGEVSKALSIPVVGIGAGLGVDALVLVSHDILGYGVEQVTKFVKQYHSVNTIILELIQAYTADLKNKRFPEEKHPFTMKEEELKVLYGMEVSNQDNYNFTGKVGRTNVVRPKRGLC